MKIKTKELSEFLKKIKMDGNETITEALFDFTEKGLVISARSPSKTSRVDAKLMTSGFVEYEAIGKIGIQDIPKIIMILDRFSDEVVIPIEGNLLKIKNKYKEMTTELLKIEFIDVVDPAKKLEFEDIFTIDSSSIQEAIADASINDEYNLMFKTVPKGFQIATTGKYKFKRNFVVDEAKGGVEVKFGKPFVNAVKSLTGKLEVSLKTKFPIKIVERTDNSIVQMIITPSIDEE